MTASTDDPTDLDALITAAKEFYRFGWLPGHTGSVSLRADEGLLINAADVHPSNLTSQDFVKVDSQGKSTSETPSQDLAIHLGIYKNLNEAGAIFHLHHLPAALCSDRDHKRGFTHFHDLEALRDLGVEEDDQGLQANISVVHPEGFDSVADAVADTLDGVDHPHTPCFTIKGQGLFVWGATADDARRHAEICAYLFEYAWQRPMHPKKSRSISGFA